MTNDDLRAGLARLSETQLGAIAANQYPAVLGVIDGVHRGESREAYTSAIMEIVDRGGDAERMRLASTLALYGVEAKGNGKAATTTVASSDDLTPIWTQLNRMQAQLERIEDVVAPLRGELRVGEWVSMRWMMRLGVVVGAVNLLLVIALLWRLMELAR